MSRKCRGRAARATTCRGSTEPRKRSAEAGFTCTRCCSTLFMNSDTPITAIATRTTYSAQTR